MKSTRKSLLEIQLFSRITFLDKMLFTKHLSIMLKSGITIAEALETIASQSKSEKFRKILLAILNDVKNGQSLASSMEKHPKAFDHFYTSLIEISEEAGTLEQNLVFLAGQLSKDYILKKKIKGALLYPMIVLSALGIVGGGMSLFVLPKLVDLFQSMDVKLPTSTKILILIATLMKEHGVLVILTLSFIVIIFRIAITFPSIKPFWQRFLLRTPLLGRFIQNGELATMCRNLGVMLKSGVPLKKALAVEQKVTDNLIFKMYISRLENSVEKGKSIEEELQNKYFSYFSPIAIKMIGVGERTGNLDEIFIYLGDFFEEEVDSITRNLSTIIEPVILLVVGLLVGWVAIAIISPIYDLTGSVKR